MLDEALRRRLETGLGAATGGVGELLAAVRAGSIDPYTAALRVLGDPAMLAGLVGLGPPAGDGGPR